MKQALYLLSADRILLICVILFVAGCSSIATGQQGNKTVFQTDGTGTAQAFPQQQPVHTSSVEAYSTPTAPAAPTGTGIYTPSLVPETVMAPERPIYMLDTTFDYDAHTVWVDEAIIYPNRTGQTLEDLVLAVAPNAWPNCFNLELLFVDDEKIIDFTLNGRRMDILLPAALLPGKAVRISLQYKLNLPFIEEVDPTIAGPRIFGYTDHQQNLTNWYPFVVPFLEGDWILHEPANQGEFLVYDASDFDVRLRFTNPDTAPIIASSGFLEGGDDPAYARYILKAGRTFVFSTSREYQISHARVGDVIVYSYYFPSFETGGKAALKAITKAIEIYSTRFGSYPHKTMSVVMGDFRGSMEHSALFFHGRTAYKLYDGTVNNEFISISVHETAHQWWFDQVGNDQAIAPWLDEALSTYSERIFYESVSPSSVQGWWWPIRVDLYKPEGFVDNTIYDIMTYRPYVNAVYLRGAHFLEELRSRIGEEAFFSFLQAYYTVGQGTIANSEVFLDILDKHADVDISDLVADYFKNASLR